MNARLRALACVLIMTSGSSFARAAEDKAACRASFQKGQDLREEGKLTAARAQFVTCTQVCPVAFTKPCEEWLGELDQSLPTIVLRAIDAQGQDLVDIAVTLDGAPLTKKLDGKSVAIDPGTHVVRFEVAGRPAVTKNVVVAQGEKDRVVLATIDTGVAPPPIGPTTEADAAPRHSTPIAAWIVGGLGVVAIGGFAYFGLTANAQHTELVNGCSKTASCTQSDKDAVVTKWHVADAFLAGGVALLGVGTYLFLSHDDAPSTRRTSVGVHPSYGGAMADVRFSF